MLQLNVLKELLAKETAREVPVGLIAELLRGSSLQDLVQFLDTTKTLGLHHIPELDLESLDVLHSAPILTLTMSNESDIAGRASAATEMLKDALPGRVITTENAAEHKTEQSRPWYLNHLNLKREIRHVH